MVSICSIFLLLTIHEKLRRKSWVEEEFISAKLIMANQRNYSIKASSDTFKLATFNLIVFKLTFDPRGSLYCLCIKKSELLLQWLHINQRN